MGAAADPRRGSGPLPMLAVSIYRRGLGPPTKEHTPPFDKRAENMIYYAPVEGKEATRTGREASTDNGNRETER